MIVVDHWDHDDDLDCYLAYRSRREREQTRAEFDSIIDRLRGYPQEIMPRGWWPRHQRPLVLAGALVFCLAVWVGIIVGIAALITAVTS